MNSYLKIQLLVCGVCLLSCNEDKESYLIDTLPSQELNLSVGIVESTETRSSVVVEGTRFDHESQINVLLVDYNGSGNVDYNNAAPYTYKDPTTTFGVWLPSNAAHSLAISDKEARVLAHYPANLPNGSVLSDNKRTLTPQLATTLNFGNVLNNEYNGDNTFYFSSAKVGDLKEVFFADGEVDYLVGASATPASNQTEESKKANILMKHCLSMVVFHIKKAEENTIKGVVKSLELKNTDPLSGPLRKGDFDLQTQFFSANSDRVNYKRTMDGFPNSSYFGMMVYPATIGHGEVKLDLFVDEASHYTIGLPSRKWNSGQVYFYEVTLKPIGAELVDEVLVVDWITGREFEFEIN